MKKIFRKEFLIGAIALLALAILFFGIDFLKGVNLFHASNYYYANYSNVTGLAISAPVNLNGFKVGQVREMTYDYEHPGTVKVELSLNSELKIPKGSKAVLATDMLGTSTIELHLADNSSFYEIGSQIESENAKGLMEGLTSDVMPSATNIFAKVDSLLTTTNALLADPAVMVAIKRLDVITADLAATTAQLRRTMATMPATASDVKGITTSFSTTSDNLAQLSGTLNRMPLDSLAADLAATTANLRLLSEQLNEPNSTLGKMMHDPALYNNLNATISSLDSLFVDIKQNPKRYISIKLL